MDCTLIIMPHSFQIVVIGESVELLQWLSVLSRINRYQFLLTLSYLAVKSPACD